MMGTVGKALVLTAAWYLALNDPGALAWVLLAITAAALIAANWRER